MEISSEELRIGTEFKSRNRSVTDDSTRGSAMGASENVGRKMWDRQKWKGGKCGTKNACIISRVLCITDGDEE